MESTKGLQIRLREDEPIEVCELVHRLETNSHSKSVRAMLSGAELVFPRDKSEPSRALLMRRAYLARRAEEREYDKMVASVQKKSIPPDQRVGNSIRFQATVSLNMIVAPVASFFVTYLASRSISKDMSTVRFESLKLFCTLLCVVQRIVFGLFGAIGMLLVEMVLFITRSFALESTSRKSARGASKTS